MPAIAHETMIELFYSALEQEIGVLIEIDKPKEFRNALYNARKADGNPKLNEIIIFLPASNDRLFLAKKSVELEP